MQRTDFNIHFDNSFATMNQTKFEDWFAAMASRVFGNDFELIKAGGKHGDKKSDGIRISTKTVYQCYAPESPSTFASKAPAKVKDSFPEVIVYWPDLKEWIFVHNNSDGITATVSDTLEVLRNSHPEIIISTGTRSFLKDEFHDKLTLQQLIDVYPNASLNFNDVQMVHVRPLLKKIVAERTVNSNPDYFGEIPDEAKLDFNGLCPDSKYVIHQAQPHIGVVKRYIADMSTPQNATIIQAEIRAKYIELKDLGHDPDEILSKLLIFCGGEGTAKIVAAAYVIVAYYFDSCDVFENVPQVTPC